MMSKPLLFGKLFPRLPRRQDSREFTTPRKRLPEEISSPRSASPASSLKKSRQVLGEFEVPLNKCNKRESNRVRQFRDRVNAGDAAKQAALWPWTLSSLVLGVALGLMTQWTGNLGAAVVAHFVINLLNMAYITRTLPPVHVAAMRPPV